MDPNPGAMQQPYPIMSQSQILPVFSVPNQGAAPMSLWPPFWPALQSVNAAPMSFPNQNSDVQDKEIQALKGIVETQQKTINRLVKKMHPKSAKSRSRSRHRSASYSKKRRSKSSRNTSKIRSKSRCSSTFRHSRSRSPCRKNSRRASNKCAKSRPSACSSSQSDNRLRSSTHTLCKTQPCSGSRWQSSPSRSEKPYCRSIWSSNLKRELPVDAPKERPVWCAEPDRWSKAGTIKEVRKSSPCRSHDGRSFFGCPEPRLGSLSSVAVKAIVVKEKPKICTIDLEKEAKDRAAMHDLLQNAQHGVISRSAMDSCTQPCLADLHEVLVLRCAFCSGGHCEELCEVFPDCWSRAKQANRLNLCSKELKPKSKHSHEHCRHECRYCSRQHHESLCPRKYGTAIVDKRETSEKPVNFDRQNFSEAGGAGRHKTTRIEIENTQHMEYSAKSIWSRVDIRGKAPDIQARESTSEEPGVKSVVVKLLDSSDTSLNRMESVVVKVPNQKSNANSTKSQKKSEKCFFCDSMNHASKYCPKYTQEVERWSIWKLNGESCKVCLYKKHPNLKKMQIFEVLQMRGKVRTTSQRRPVSRIHQGIELNFVENAAGRNFRREMSSTSGRIPA